MLRPARCINAVHRRVQLDARREAQGPGVYTFNVRGHRRWLPGPRRHRGGHADGPRGRPRTRPSRPIADDHQSYSWTIPALHVHGRRQPIPTCPSTARPSASSPRSDRRHSSTRRRVRSARPRARPGPRHRHLRRGRRPTAAAPALDDTEGSTLTVLEVTGRRPSPRSPTTPSRRDDQHLSPPIGARSVKGSSATTRLELQPFDGDLTLTGLATAMRATPDSQGRDPSTVDTFPSRPATRSAPASRHGLRRVFTPTLDGTPVHLVGRLPSDRSRRPSRATVNRDDRVRHRHHPGRRRQLSTEGGTRFTATATGHEVPANGADLRSWQ